MCPRSQHHELIVWAIVGRQEWLLHVSSSLPGNQEPLKNLMCSNFFFNKQIKTQTSNGASLKTVTLCVHTSVYFHSLDTIQDIWNALSKFPLESGHGQNQKFCLVTD